MLLCRVVILVLGIVLATPFAAMGQSSDTPSPQPQSDETLLKPEQLEALVAPIALYPDALLANMLAASTYPLEVVEAARWIKDNKNLKGDQLRAQLDKRSWDDSVKALVSTPTVLDMMNDKLDWTKSLGDAVLAQQPEVMDAIQRLRARAQANNKLVSTKEQKVIVQTVENKPVIVIEPTDPGTMYVPYYDPAIVYGTWPYAAYPPYYFGYPGYIGAGVIATGLAFGAGIALGRWSNYWGGGFRWGNNNFFINRSNTNVNWSHNVAHRQGVRYNNANVAQRYGGDKMRAGAAGRMDYRGRGGEQVLNPNRAGAGDRAANRGERVGDRGDRGGDRVGAGDRGAGDRARGGDRAGARTGDRAANMAGGAKQARQADRPRPSAGARGGGARDNAMKVQGGRAASMQSARGRASFASAGGGGRGAISAGGGPRGGGGGGRGGGGGGRRSDLALKHDVSLLGYLNDGLGYYRFSYVGDNKAYVGVIAQEVQRLRPDAVTRDRDGYLRVYYDKLGLRFRTYQDWLAQGARIPARTGM